VFMDYAAALFLQDKSVGDGRFVFNNYPNGPQTYATEQIYDCPAAPITRNVHQYGIDYISIACAGNFTLHFEGSTVASLLPVDPHSGGYFVWSNKGDESDITLTREFDLTSVSGPAEISYWTWYDLEKDYDYLYLEVSEDGENWQIIQAPSTTDSDPTGANLGWAYNGLSGGWIEETVDLSTYVGKKIQIRFEYITDAAVNGEGLLLDDVRVDAIGYASDFESDLGGWDAQGFVRAQNILPQTFRLALIIQSGGETTVQYIELNADQTADIPLTLEAGDTVTLIVTGTTRFTRATATYSIEIK
jgi:immune inhibitor A